MELSLVPGSLAWCRLYRLLGGFRTSECGMGSEEAALGVKEYLLIPAVPTGPSSPLHAGKHMFAAE